MSNISKSKSIWHTFSMLTSELRNEMVEDTITKDYCTDYHFFKSLRWFHQHVQTEWCDLVSQAIISSPLCAQKHLCQIGVGKNTLLFLDFIQETMHASCL